MFFRMIVSGFVLIAFLGGCATTSTETAETQDPQKPRPDIITREPELAIEASNGVGQPIYRYKIEKPPTVDIILGHIRIEDNILLEEILFSGFSQGTLRATYREFVNDMARPAFSQEATYDFTPGTPSTISFNGAQIEVIDANNNEIRYRVLRGFDGEQESVPAELPAK